jgi:two-component system response regulator FlrC
VRELENVVQRAVVLCTGQAITPSHLLFDEMSSMDRVDETVVLSAPTPVAPTAPAISETQPAWEASHPAAERDMPAQEQPVALSVVPAMPQPLEVDAGSVNLQDVIKTSEHAVIMSAIQNTDSREEAARLLGISPRTLRYKLAQLRERGLMLNAA